MVSSSRALLPRIWHDVPRERASLSAFRDDCSLAKLGQFGQVHSRELPAPLRSRPQLLLNQEDNLLLNLWVV